MLLLGALAFRMRFHLPLALVVMNIGFGPLFLLWGTLEVVCGAWLRSGCDPFTRWQEVRVLFANPLVDLSTFVFSLLGDWLLGCMLVVPVVAALAAISTWMAIRWYDRMRLRF